MNSSRITAKIINHSHGQGLTSVDDLRQRASELAEIDGRPGEEYTDADLDAARRELMGGHSEEPEPGDSLMVGADFVASSTGHHVPNYSSDESENAVAELISEGMEEAEHEQMLVRVLGTTRTPTRKPEFF